MSRRARHLGLLALRFGVAEAIGATVFVGLSVDHCLHLAHAYHQAPGDQLAKIRHALVLTGASILGGALTTMAGTAFLLPCRIILFQKLGAEGHKVGRKMRLDALRELCGVDDLDLLLLEPHAHHLRAHRMDLFLLWALVAQEARAISAHASGWEPVALRSRTARRSSQRFASGVHGTINLDALAMAQASSRDHGQHSS